MHHRRLHDAAPGGLAPSGGCGTAAISSVLPTLGRSALQRDGRPRQPLGRAFSSSADFRVDHPYVDAFVSRFQTDRRASFQEALDRSGKYWDRIAVILEEEGLPIELAYVPLIESGYRTDATSPAGAAGPWQFVAATGRAYGLRIDRYVDERRDPVRSTRAAARYLRDLHAMFGSWPLSLAAYNAGPRRLARRLPPHVIPSFADMVVKAALPTETRNYVSQVLAAVRIAAAPERHGFLRPDDQRVEYDLVSVRPGLDFRAIAAMVGVSVMDIAELNPALVRNITPPDPDGYRVRLPKGTKASFALAYARMEDPRGRAAGRRCRSRVLHDHGTASTLACTADPLDDIRPSGDVWAGPVARFVRRPGVGCTRRCSRPPANCPPFPRGRGWRRSRPYPSGSSDMMLRNDPSVPQADARLSARSRQ